MAANRIVVSEMGTMAYPDPSKNFIFKYVLTPVVANNKKEEKKKTKTEHKGSVLFAAK